VKVTMMLADAAQQVGGKLYILGGGWSITGPNPTPSALAIKIEVPWELANRPHDLLIELIDSDGRPVQIEEGKPAQILGKVEVGRPAGLAAGTPLDAPLAVTIAPIAALKPGQRYLWRLSINGESQPDWNVAFSVRQAPAPPPQQH
jgi:hypothetical protein